MSEERVGGPYPPPFSGKVKLKNLLKSYYSHCKITFKTANQKNYQSDPALGKMGKISGSACAWLLFGVMQVNYLTLGCNSILY